MSTSHPAQFTDQPLTLRPDARSPLVFSVITISFNVREALRRTIESVNEQTYPHVEHVFIDGASTDGSPALIRRLALRGVRLTSEPDNGIGHAFNKGTQQSRGHYLCYLNAGDQFAAPDVLARAAEVIEQSPRAQPTVFYGDFISMDREGPRLHRASADLRDFEWGNPINHQAAFVPRGTALAFPYDERLMLGMDYDFWLRIIERVRFHKLEFPVSIFEMGGRSSAPAWEVHNLNIHRMLWHINRGTRLGAKDMLTIAALAARLKFKWAVRRLLGERLSLAIRSAKSRRIEQRSRPSVPRLA